MDGFTACPANPHPPAQREHVRRPRLCAVDFDLKPQAGTNCQATTARIAGTAWMKKIRLLTL